MKPSGTKKHAMMKRFKNALRSSDMRNIIMDKDGNIILTVEQQDMLMDIADKLEPGWESIGDKPQQELKRHWLYKFVRTKLYGLLLK